MKEFSLQVSDLSSPNYLLATAEEKAAWLTLLAYCAQAENGGRIENGGEVVHMLRLCLDLERESRLYTWDGPAIVVWGYPQKQEQAVRAKRAGGKKGMGSRWTKDSYNLVTKRVTKRVNGVHKVEQTDAEWMAELKTKDAYSHIAIDHEYQKCADWCRLNGKQMSRRRFFNWISRIPRPMKYGRGDDLNGALMR